MPKIVDLSKVQRSKERRLALKKRLSKYKKQGEDVDMTLDEMRMEIIELWEKIGELEASERD